MLERPSTLERLVFFSDAVFAIAITLLAIDLRLPATLSPNDNGSLAAAFHDALPELFAFALSFFIVATFWMGHLRTMRATERTNSRFVALNLLFLFFIALLPFPTSVIAQHGDLSLGAIAYAAFGAVTGLVSNSLWLYATRVGGLAPRVSPELSRSVALRGLVGPALFAISIPVALVSPFAAEIVWVFTMPATLLVSNRLGVERAIEASLSRE
ncbi:MAG TPA: TMEM175 family protein [Candidatus Limnocylindrales bacterium]|nr:TMEM175 family protein [Candidatus Limnocylindrales bacterium]